MIVYNVARRWFPMKSDAEAYRKAQGLKPDALSSVAILGREELAAFLTGLCEPSLAAKNPGQHGFMPAAILDRAYVEPDFDIPTFLLRDKAEYEARQRRKAEQEG